MSYDRNGNWDYEAAAMGTQLRAHGRWMRARGGLGEALRVVAAIVCGLLIAALILAVGFGSNYVRGRAIGAGVRDALEDR